MKNREKNRKRIPAALGFLVIFAVLLVLVTKLMMVNEGLCIATIKGFYQEPRDSLDVALVGPSELYNGYAAPLAWEEYGYTSYAMSISSAEGRLYKSMTREILKRQSPKLLVYNVGGFTWGDNPDTTDPVTHTWIDNQPWSMDKLHDIAKLVPEEKRMEYYFPLVKYHSGWKQPGRCVKAAAVRLAMLFNGFSYTKGFETYSYCDGGGGHADTEELSFTGQSRTQLRELLQYCRDSGVNQVLFVAFPHQMKTVHPEVLDEIGQVVTEEYGYDFLNLNKDYQKTGISDETDFFNADHLNVLGLEKMTDYLGQYITEHYDVSHTQSKKETAYWNRCAARSRKLMDEAKEDLEEGVARKYFEFSVYMKNPPMEQPGIAENNYGACADVVGFALKNSGYDIQELLQEDILEQRAYIIGHYRMFNANALTK